MKRVANILLFSITLTLMLFGVMGVSVEKCSCTGKISLTMHAERSCCPDEDDCMTVRTMQLSDYLPTTTASLDLPHQPVLFALFPRLAPVQTTLPEWQQDSLFAEAPPGALAHTGESVLLC